MANLLKDSGLFIGDRLAGATPSNVKGHFEDIDILEFHERMLKTNNTTMYLHQDRKMILTPQFYHEAETIVARRNEKHQLWGFKQPRATLFLDLWKVVLPSAMYIVSFRHPSAVINSIIRREANKLILRNDEKTGPKLKANYLQNLSDHAARYDAMNAVHLKRLINFHRSYDRSKIHFVNFDEIGTEVGRLQNFLNAYHIHLTLDKIESLFSEKLLIKPEEHQVSEQDVSARSMRLYNEILDLSKS